MWRKLRAWAEQFGATVTPVNPNRDRARRARRAYPPSTTCPAARSTWPSSWSATPSPPFEEVAAAKAKFAVIFAAGFAEVGGEGVELQARLAELVDGVRHPPARPQHQPQRVRDVPRRPTRPAPRPHHPVGPPGPTGLPVPGPRLRHVALGAGRQRGRPRVRRLRRLVRRRSPTTGAIAAYIEGFKDGRTVQLAADAAMQRGVPIVCVKVGKTDEGRSMAASHTGHLTGADRVIDGVFRQYGVTRVDGLDELTELAAAFCRTVGPAAGAGRRAPGVRLRHLRRHRRPHGRPVRRCRAPDRARSRPEDRRPSCGRHIPDYLRVSNPVDNGGAPSGDERGRKILDAIVADPKIDAVIVPITGALASMSRPLHPGSRRRAAHDRQADLRGVGLAAVRGLATPQVLAPNGVPCSARSATASGPPRAWFDYWDAQQRWSSPFAKPVTRALAGGGRGRGRSWPGARRRPLSEHDSKAVLAAYGIPVTRDVLLRVGRRRRTGASASSAAPVVMKIASPDIAHKSDLGLVRLGVDGAAADAPLLGRLHGHRRPQGQGRAQSTACWCARRRRPASRRMVGVSRDELFGPAVAFGLGGVLRRGVRRRGRPRAAVRPRRGPAHDRRDARSPGAGRRRGAPSRPRCRPWSTCS